MRVRSISLALVAVLLALFRVSTIEARKSTSSTAAFSPALTLVSRLPVAEADYTSTASADLVVTSPPHVPRGGETRALVVVEILKRLKIASYFALWYALNVVYNSKYKMRVYIYCIIIQYYVLHLV
jgi:hypothetical protein